MKPECNFFIVGGQRCGTSWLYTQLDGHPDICMAKPARPEPKYFLQKTGEPKQAYYQAFYAHHAGEKCMGEKSTSYCDSEKAPENICAMFPDARILFVLRNPVERALSNYFFSVANGLESRTLEEVFIQQKPAPVCHPRPSTDPFDYVGRGNYALFLERYMKTFGHNRVLPALFEDMVKNRSELYKIFRFIGIEPSNTVAEQFSKINPAPRNTNISTDVLEEIARQSRGYVEILAELIPQLNLTAWEHLFSK